MDGLLKVTPEELEKTADKAGIKTFNDIEIIDDDKHPLIAITESIQDNEKSD